MVRERTLRKDLFYRLRVVPLELPPLTERREDILPLARQFITRACTEHSCGPCSLSTEVLDLLMTHDWPGNLHELENAIERALLLAEGKPLIEIGGLPPEIRRSVSSLALLPSPGRPLSELTLAPVERSH